ncbi:unnamed protein product [marine sediment metagenome]|uniref:Uncharacterized protein n=1 Tax=marine sediment metagenome TaxID=412755 RepID=X1AG65_9ZZZZ
MILILNLIEKPREYYIVWEPVVIAMGKTRHEALEDLREAAHCGVDTLIDLKLKNIKKED